MNIIRTDSEDVNFQQLIKLLDEDLHNRYGAIQSTYSEHNKVDKINHVIVVLDKDRPVACGSYKKHDASSVELKRMYVVKEYRRQGLAKLVVRELLKMAKEESYSDMLLETGIKQYEAIKLYESLGFCKVDNFSPYIGNTNSVCMKKHLED